MSRNRITQLAVLAAAALAACGDDAPEPAAKKPAAVASADRYCRLVERLDAAGEAHFASLGRDAGPAEYEAAERAFVEANADRFAQLEAAAPAPIAGDVRTLLAAQRERAGLETAAAPGQRAATAAEKRIKRYERRNC